MEKALFKLVAQRLKDQQSQQAPATAATSTAVAPHCAEEQLYVAANDGDRSSLQAVLTAGGGGAASVDLLESKHGEDDQTALHAAAGKGHVDCTSDLIKAGASVGAADTHGWTPLHMTVDNCSKVYMPTLLRMFGLMVAPGTSVADALLNRHEACASLLLEAGANVDAADKRGITPLHIAAQEGHVSCVSLLLEAGANVHAADKQGRTPLCWAVWFGHEASVSLLLAAGANVDATDEAGQTPLCRVVWMGSTACVLMLLAAGANVDAADEYGRTPLHKAADKGRESRVSLLLQAGAKLGAVASDGSTPLSIADENGYGSVVAMLQGEARWRRRRALALVREQREAGSDWRKARKVWKHSSAM